MPVFQFFMDFFMIDEQFLDAGGVAEQGDGRFAGEPGDVVIVVMVQKYRVAKDVTKTGGESLLVDKRFAMAEFNN